MDLPLYASDKDRKNIVVEARAAPGQAAMTATTNDGVTVEDRYCTHILSERSRSLGRDTFVFWSAVPSLLLVGKHLLLFTGNCCQAQLRLGVNQRLTHMTSEGLHRWLRLIMPYMPDTELRPVAVRKIDVMRHAVDPSDVIIALDTFPLPSGDYGLFCPFALMCDSWYFLQPFAVAGHPLDGEVQSLAMGHEVSFEGYMMRRDPRTRLDLVCVHR
jgi:hypothetical protein